MTDPRELTASPGSADGARAAGRPWATGEFRSLIAAQVTSEIGDQFARVAVAGIVLDRSGSALYSALAFVVSYLPGIAGALLLGPLADRLPRRLLMVWCDVARGVVVAILALAVAGEAPLWSLMALLLFAELFSAPFDAARSAIVADVLPDPADFHAGAGISRVLYQLNQTVGLALGGLVAYGASAQLALWLDVASYGISGVLLLSGVRSRPAALADGPLGLDVAVAARLVFTDPVRRVFVTLGWAAGGVLIAPEAVALAYAAEHGDERLGGVLIASLPAGAALGAWLISRYPPVVAVRMIRPLLAAGCLPLVLTGLDLGVGPTLVLWTVAGVCQAFLVPVMVVVTLVTPPERRGTVGGLAAAGFNAAVALSFVLAGWVADVLDPAGAVCAAGGVGLFVLLVAQLCWPSEQLDAVLA
ncbi:MAG TPA: MFS transporter [Sporichthya sp.]|nr:MFS transporter [Sporichthya sp.]